MGACVLFVYGTLLDEAVLRAVLGDGVDHLTQQPALLRGFGRWTVHGAVYPGIWPASGASTPGRVLRDLSLAQLDVLDAFEGEEYRREAVTVESGSQRVQAGVYVWAGREEALFGEWSLSAFQADRSQYAAYVSSCQAWRRSGGEW